MNALHTFLLVDGGHSVLQRRGCIDPLADPHGEAVQPDYHTFYPGSAEIRATQASRRGQAVPASTSADLL